MTAAEWLASYEGLSEWEAEVAALFEEAENGDGSYAQADEQSTDLNYAKAELVDAAADIIRALTNENGA